MNLEEYKELFEKLQLFPTLDSISLLLSYTNNQLIKIAFNSVYMKKYEECKDEFEGINEYDDISLVSNFDISELKKILIYLIKKN